MEKDMFTINKNGFSYSYAMLMNEARITRNQERIYQNDEMELLRLGCYDRDCICL